MFVYCLYLFLGLREVMLPKAKRVPAIQELASLARASLSGKFIPIYIVMFVGVDEGIL